MTAEEAQALVPNDKIQYVDGRIATVGGNNPTGQEVEITFDADTQDPKPRAYIKYWDFIRATKVDPLARQKVFPNFEQPVPVIPPMI
jgi:hypothetical protein